MFLFNKKNSLKNKKDIENLFKNGKSCSHMFLRTMYLPGESFLKTGVSVPKN
ncbi:ribonuclease P protein component [Flavobacteriaceae bacterium]|nr:ribonuclease P protein component [Flavobacteriaceae bacterium]